MTEMKYGNPFCQETGTSIVTAESFCPLVADSENYVEKDDDFYRILINKFSNYLFHGTYSLFLQPIIDREKIIFREYFRQPLPDHHSEDMFRYIISWKRFLDVYFTNISDFYLPIYREPVEEIEALRGKIDILTDDAIHELKDNFLLLNLLSGTFLKSVKQKISEENIEYELSCNVFYDIEIENWKTINLVIKIKDYESIEYEKIKTLWNTIISIKVDNLNKLKDQFNLSDKEIMELKNLFIITIEPY